MANMSTSPATGGINLGNYQFANLNRDVGSANQFEVFLRMLTTQIRNQDPLNPMENTEFAVQLATFSGVEQQVQTNLLLTQILQGANGGGLAQISQWIGREARTSAPVWFDRTPLTLFVNSADDAGNAMLITLDEKGREVMRQSLGSYSGEVNWLGQLANGDFFSPGFYSFRIEETRNDGSVSVRNAEAYSRVMGIELSRSGPQLILKGGGAVKPEDVTALRE